MPACGPVREIALTPRAWRAIETSVAAWCSPVASRRSSSRGSGSSVIGRGQPEQLVGRVAHGADDDHEVVPGRALTRDAPRHVPDAVGVGDRRATVLLDDEGRGPRGPGLGRHRGAFYRPAPGGPSWPWWPLVAPRGPWSVPVPRPTGKT